MNIQRSPRLKPNRPFQIRREPWFGKNYLNGAAWVITIRRGDQFLTCWVGAGADLRESVEYAREQRRNVPRLPATEIA
jgi:hypothetical protein